MGDEVYSSSTGLGPCTSFRDINTRIRRYKWYVWPNVFIGKARPPTTPTTLPSPRGSSHGMDTLHMCATVQGRPPNHSVDIWPFVWKTCVFYAVACNYLLSLKDRVLALCSMFNISVLYLRMVSWNGFQTCLGVPAVASFRNKVTKKKLQKRLTRLGHWWHVVGEDTFSRLAPVLAPTKQSWRCHPFYCS